MNLKIKIPFFNKNKKTYSDCVEDVRESDSFYIETGHSGFSEEALSQPLVSQQTRALIKGISPSSNLMDYKSLVDEYGIPNSPFYAKQPDTEELLMVANNWITDNIERLNRDKSKDLSFPSFKESLDLEREDETLKDERLRNVYLKKRVRREMRKEEKEALRIKKLDRKRNLILEKEAEDNNSNKRYVEMSLSIINKADVITRHNNSYTVYTIKYISNDKKFILTFTPQYKEYTHYDDRHLSIDIGRCIPYEHRIESLQDGRISINETETEHCLTNLVNYNLTERQSNMLNSAINKRLNHIKRHTLYEMFKNLDMNKTED